LAWETVFITVRGYINRHSIKHTAPPIDIHIGTVSLPARK